MAAFRIHGEVRVDEKGDPVLYQGKQVVGVPMPMCDGFTQDGVRYGSELVVLLAYPPPDGQPKRYHVTYDDGSGAQDFSLRWGDRYFVRPVEGWHAYADVLLVDDFPAVVFNEIRPGMAEA